MSIDTIGLISQMFHIYSAVVQLQRYWAYCTWQPSCLSQFHGADIADMSMICYKWLIEQCFNVSTNTV